MPSISIELTKEDIEKMIKNNRLDITTCLTYKNSDFDNNELFKKIAKEKRKEAK